MTVAQRRRLTDLYARRRTVAIADDDGPIEVEIRKMTPSESDECYAKATAARSRAVAVSTTDPQDDSYVALMGEVNDMSRDILIEWCLNTETTRRRQTVEAMTAFQDEWLNDRYLQGLKETEADPAFEAKALLDPDDVEVVKVRAEIKRFNDQCDENLRLDADKIRRELEEQSDAEMREKVIAEVLDMRANAVWLIEYQKQQVLYCTYDPEDHTRYFKSRAEVELLQEETLSQLAGFIDELHVGDQEGKD